MDQIYILSNDVKIVNGATNSCIYDLKRKKGYLINKQELNNVDEFLKYQDFDKVDSELIIRLIELELIIKVSNFIQSKLISKNQSLENIQYPFYLFACLIDYSDIFVNNIPAIFSILKKYNCKSITILLKDKITLDEILLIFERIKSLNLTFDSIDIYANEVQGISFEKIIKVPNHNNCFIFVLNKFELEVSGYYYYSKNRSFYISYDYFNESYFYNPFFYKKIYIDEELNLKTTPLSEISYGNILENHEKILNPNIFLLWNINKDKIEICKDCELRYMCIDDRVPKFNNNIWQYDTKCHYDPYLEF